MSEEEKFKIYLRILNEENSIDKKEEAMLGLLGLYYKQQTEIEELKEKNASLQKEIKLMKSININDNYISKDKIIAKIKEFKQVRNEILKNEKEFNRPMITYDLKRNDYCEKMLQELLKEE